MAVHFKSQSHTAFQAYKQSCILPDSLHMLAPMADDFPEAHPLQELLPEFMKASQQICRALDRNAFDYFSLLMGLLISSPVRSKPI